MLLKCKITSVVSRLAWLLPLTLSPRQPSYDGASVCLMVCECASAGSLCAPVRACARVRVCACMHPCRYMSAFDRVWSRAEAKNGEM